MELDELKQAWQTLDERLDRQGAIQWRLFQESRLSKAKSGFHWLAACKIVQIALGFFTISFCVSFWMANRGNPALLASGIVTQAFATALVVAGVIELLLIARIRYAEPVTTIQKYLTYLRLWRSRIIPWLGLVQWLLWIPLTMIAFKWWFGVDLWARAPATVYGFFAVSIAGLLTTLWLIYWSPHSLRARVGRYFDQSNTGPAVDRAQSILDEIERFQKE